MNKNVQVNNKSYKRKKNDLNLLVNIDNLSTQEAEVKRPWVKGQAELHTGFEASVGYLWSYLKKQTLHSTN